MALSSPPRSVHKTTLLFTWAALSSGFGVDGTFSILAKMLPEYLNQPFHFNAEASKWWVRKVDECRGPYKTFGEFIEAHAELLDPSLGRKATYK